MLNKYYVQSGEIKTIILAEDARDACIRSVKNRIGKNTKISSMFIVSERGFALDRYPTVIDTTEPIFSSMDIIDECKK